MEDAIMKRNAWINATAGLRNIDTELIFNLLCECNIKYGNSLTPHEKLIYVRNILEKEHPILGFRFCGGLYNDKAEWLSYVPEWFKCHYTLNGTNETFNFTRQQLFGRFPSHVNDYGDIVYKDVIYAGDYILRLNSLYLHCIPDYVMMDIDDITDPLLRDITMYDRIHDIRVALQKNPQQSFCSQSLPF